MENKLIYKKIEKGTDFKTNLCYNSTLYQPIEINKTQMEIDDQKKEINIEPIFNLLENLEEINRFLPESNCLEFLYFNRDKVDSILYEKDTIIHINSIKNDKLLFNSHLYLNLLIESNSNVVIYKYPIELIKEINEIQLRENKKNIIKKVILAKIIITLVVNYEQDKDFDENDNNLTAELSRYKSHNINIIIENEKFLEEYQLKNEDILKTKIDEIYSSIIKQLIIKDQFKEFEKTYEIMKSLDLENFYITKTIFDELKNVLDLKKEYIKKYIINKYEDIFNEEILTFYYILFKFILKNPIYIYQIPFLLKTRNNILKFIKENIEELYYTIRDNKNIKDKIIYVLNYFIVFDYYYQNSLKRLNRRSINSSSSSGNNSMDQNLEIDNFSSFSFFNGGSFKNARRKSGGSLDIFEEPEKKEYNQEMKKSEKESLFYILEYSTFYLHTNKKGYKPSIIFDEISVAYQNRKFTIDEIKNMTSKDESLNKNYKQFLKVLETIISRIKKEFSFRYKLRIILNFKTIAIENAQFKIKCNYTVEIPNEKPFDYKDENILEKELTAGFPYLLNEINNEVYNDLKYED